MKRKSSPHRKSVNVPLFIVEGYTEENYIKILKRVFQKNVSIHNCEGGGAHSVLLQSDKILSDKDEATYYTSFVIIYDSDTDNPRYDSLLYKINTNELVNLLILDPCFENWLLLHVHHKKVKNTDNCDKCVTTLKKYVPNYEKDNCKTLEKFVNENTFNQACVRQTEIGNVLKKYF